MAKYGRLGYAITDQGRGCKWGGHWCPVLTLCIHGTTNLSQGCLRIVGQMETQMNYTRYRDCKLAGLGSLWV